MSIQTTIRFLAAVTTLAVASSAFAAPPLGVRPAPKQAVMSARLCEPSQSAPGYRDIFVRFGVRSQVDARPVAAR